MTYISGTQLSIYVGGIALVLLLLGLVGSKYLTFDITDNSDNPYSPETIENLTVPSISSSGDVSTGASELYGWGYTPIKSKKHHKKHREHKKRQCPSCENVFVDEIDLCVLCEGGNRDCRFADITRNVNIDKYVLKSSIPSCQNLSDYAKKSDIPPYPFNKDDWILKSEIPPCPSIPDMRKYILKSEIPSLIQTECPKAPVCPIAPTCPPCEIVDKVYNDNFFTGNWVPKLSEMNEGFVQESMAPSVHMARCMDAIPRKR